MLIVKSTSKNICISKYRRIFFILHRLLVDILSHVLNDCKAIDNKTEEEFVLQALNFANSVLVVSSFLYLGAGVFYFIAAATTFNQENKQLLFEATYPFESSASPMFEILFITQMITMFFGCVGVAFADSLLIMLVCNRFQKFCNENF